MTITITDIANQAGVSRAMVSRALTGSGPVKQAKKEEIIALAKAMGYSPNRAALQLRSAKSNLIGLYFSTIGPSTSPYVLHDVLTGAYETMDDRYQIVVKGIDRHQSGTLNPSQYDGLLIMSQWDQDIEFLEEAATLQLPMVALSRHVPTNIPAVTTDERSGMEKAMTYLLEHGHKNIGIIEGPNGLEANTLRHAGWIDAARKYGLPIHSFPIAYGNFRYRSGYKAAQSLYETYPGLTAFLCFNDEMALGARSFLYQQGLRIPEDFSLTGFDNLDIPRYADLSLTTVERSAREIAKAGTQMLMQYIETGRKPEDCCLDDKLIVRNSVKDIKTNYLKM